MENNFLNGDCPGAEGKDYRRGFRNATLRQVPASRSCERGTDMSTIPLLISVPHAGTRIPREVLELNRLSRGQIVSDGDAGAAAIYGRLKNHVRHFVTADVARAYVDLNREETDIRKDGVVKTHTCWDEPVYSSPLCPERVRTLIRKYHRPYHRKLEALSGRGVMMGIDCHTMAETGPPVGPDSGMRRPHVCIGDTGGTSCPGPWTELLAKCLERSFEGEVRVNSPFGGGWITRRHQRSLPWIQVEISRAPFAPEPEKGLRMLKALRLFCRSIGAAVSRPGIIEN